MFPFFLMGATSARPTNQKETLTETGWPGSQGAAVRHPLKDDNWKHWSTPVPQTRTSRQQAGEVWSALRGMHVNWSSSPLSAFAHGRSLAKAAHDGWAEKEQQTKQHVFSGPSRCCETTGDPAEENAARGASTRSWRPASEVFGHLCQGTITIRNPCRTRGLNQHQTSERPHTWILHPEGTCSSRTQGKLCALPPTRKKSEAPAESAKQGPHLLSPPQRKQTPGREEDRNAQNTTFSFLIFTMLCWFCRTTMSSTIIVHSPSLHPVDGGTGWRPGTVTSPLLCISEQKQIGTKSNYTSTVP